MTLDKRDSLESKLHRVSSEKISCLQETVSLLNQCIDEENEGQLQNHKDLKILGKEFKNQMKENKSYFRTVSKKRKKKKTKQQKHNKKLEKKSSIIV